MVETDQVSAVETESDDEATVDDAVQKTPSVPTSVDDAADSDDGEDDEDDEDYLVEEGEIAGDYLEQLLDVLDFDGDIDLDVEGDRAIVSIDGGDDLAKLVGRKGEVLDALQELTRLAVQQSTGERSKLMLDVAGWRAKRRTELGNLGAEAARRVLESGEREELTPMTPFERKIVHDAVAKIDGVASESTGVEPARRVVVVVKA
ncbi:single-stranded DNA-binding protein [Rhodococcus sp. 05-2256-B2]|nr:single-stranded DNA-binding protein [Rhodococcus sp. 05-2256-B4]OZD91355.1 single-stranded DNA-binding protein [Rhodococcus sp. 05-2256-B2]OZD95982.1 single-stranded DNA-binding protein [Rhodococcus sp. 05-2256-B1]OZD98816.1 single-stranded DNA-binding protein [Rhodococcus sp. 05-2256-B3]